MLPTIIDRYFHPVAVLKEKWLLYTFQNANMFCLIILASNVIPPSAKLDIINCGNAVKVGNLKLHVKLCQKLRLHMCFELHKQTEITLEGWRLMKAAISSIVRVSTLATSTGFPDEATAGFTVYLKEQLTIRWWLRVKLQKTTILTSSSILWWGQRRGPKKL